MLRIIKKLEKNFPIKTQIKGRKLKSQRRKDNIISHKIFTKKFIVKFY